MIIYIDRTIGTYGRKHQFSTDELAFFSHLAIAHRNGNCFLCGDILSIECIMNHIGGWEKSVYKWVRNHNTQVKSIIGLVESLIVLSYDNTPQVPSFISSKSRLIKIDDAISFNPNFPCALIGENLDDCKFYKLLAARYLKEHNVKGISIAFHSAQGGGATTNKAFENSVLSNHIPTLCIVDTDVKYYKTKKYPQDPAIGDTAKKVIDTLAGFPKTTPPIYDLLCLPVHEIENLIPSCIIINLSPDSKEMRAFLKSLHAINGGQPILYYDFKEGFQKIKKDQAVEYWYAIAESIGNFNPPYTGTNTLVKAIETLEEMDNNGQQTIHTVTVDDYLAVLWNDIGKKVFSWGCASNKNLA